MCLAFGLVLLLIPALGRYAVADGRSLEPAAGAVIRVELEQVLRPQLTPAFLGFNVSWRNFQVGYWRDNEVVPEVIELMAALPGVIYRYPGGTISNGFILERAIGPLASRRLQVVPNGPPMTAEFGPAEFLAFVAAVGGIPIFVLNLHGSGDELWPIEPLAAQARSLAQKFGDVGEGEGTGGRAEPEPCASERRCAVKLWELGNELDIAPYRWGAEVYSERARAIVEAIRAVNPDARFIAALATAPWSKRQDRAQTPMRFNRRVAEGLGDKVEAYAFHAYYDGLAVPAVMKALREAAAQTGAGRGDSSPRLFVTEHARWPNRPARGRWEETWHKTGDLSGALASADFFLAGLNQPEVEAALWHALGARGPWQLLKRNRSTDEVYGNVVYWAFRVLHGGIGGKLLRSVTNSPNRSGYRGGYDIRAAVILNEVSQRIAVLTVNRHAGPHPVSLVIPQLAGQRIAVAQEFVSAPLQSAANGDEEPYAVIPVTRRFTIDFDSGGVGRFDLPPNSVAATKLRLERIL